MCGLICYFDHTTQSVSLISTPSINMAKVSKQKILNDPIYGLIDFPSGELYHLVEHPFMQRLRRIKQLGLTDYIYPGARHTRFQHALGATHLMSEAINVLRAKGHEISNEEREGALIAIMLHDIGHGPFSHTLEHSLVHGLTHEDITVLFMERLNDEFDGSLSLGIDIFKNKYKKQFLHQLVSSQLDMDRLDYLSRDSYFTGVSEGVVNTDRIIKMLNVEDDRLVVDAKGLYSVENFLIARRLMYWQVYFHKTSVVVEQTLIHAIRRAKQLSHEGNTVWASPALSRFLHEDVSRDDFYRDPSTLIDFSKLDDDDIMVSLKQWVAHPDKLLSTLSRSLVERKLFKIRLQNTVFDSKLVDKIRENTRSRHDISDADVSFLVFSDQISNNAYVSDNEQIKIKYNNGDLVDVADASDISNVRSLSKVVKKFFICFPENCI